MELQPASIDQLRKASNGRWIAIEADVGNVAVQIKEIGDQRGVDLSLRVSEITGVFKVVQTIDGEEQLVTSAQELDARLVERVRQITAPTYDLAAEVEKLEAERDRQFDYEQSEKIGERAERLAHALRKDTGEEKVSIVLPRGLP